MRPEELIRSDCLEVLGQRETVRSLEALRGTHVFITGATGFTGSWLAEMIATLNDEHGFATRMTLLARGIEDFKITHRHLAARSDITLITKDVRDVTEVPQDTNWIIHAAASPDSRVHSSTPFETMAVMAQGTYAMLKAAERPEDFRMLLYISSGSVYGNQPMDLERMSESYQGAPHSGVANASYAEAKRFAETLCAAGRSQLRVPTAVVRPFAFVGPYQDLERPWAVNNFMRDALNGNPIRVMGDGQTVRSYMYGADMAVWYLTALVKGTPGAIYNVGSPDPVPLHSLASMISNAVSTKPAVQLNSTPGFAPRSRFVPDVSAAERALDVKVTVDLRTALDKTMRWHALRPATVKR